MDGNRSIIDVSSKEKGISNRQVNTKAIENSSPSFLPLDY